MYWKIEAKVGHVGGRKKYKIQTFYIAATSGKEAAYKARFAPRVKHNDKKAILSVTKISYEDFVIGNIEYKNDAFVQARNIQEQRRYCFDLEIFDEENYLEERRYEKDYDKPYNKKRALRFGYENGKRTYSKQLNFCEYVDYVYAV